MTEKQYKEAIKKTIPGFTNHILEFNKVGSLGIGISLDLDLVIYGELPVRKFKNNEFRFAIETPSGTEGDFLYRSKQFSIPVITRQKVEEVLTEALKIVYSDTSEMITNPHPGSPKKIKRFKSIYDVVLHGEFNGMIDRRTGMKLRSLICAGMPAVAASKVQKAIPYTIDTDNSDYIVQI